MCNISIVTNCCQLIELQFYHALRDAFNCLLIKRATPLYNLQGTDSWRADKRYCLKEIRLL